MVTYMETTAETETALATVGQMIALAREAIANDDAGFAEVLLSILAKSSAASAVVVIGG